MLLLLRLKITSGVPQTQPAEDAGGFQHLKTRCTTSVALLYGFASKAQRSTWLCISAMGDPYLLSESKNSFRTRFQLSPILYSVAGLRQTQDLTYIEPSLMLLLRLSSQILQYHEHSQPKRVDHRLAPAECSLQ